MMEDNDSIDYYDQHDSKSVFSFQKSLLNLPENTTTINYHSWLENIRIGINSWRDHKEFEGLTNFEFSQKVLRQLKLKTSEDFVKYILNHSSLTILKASDNKTINYNIALLLEQIDLNRNGKISGRELLDFLFPAPGIRELGLLIKFVREGFAKELSNGSKSQITAGSSESELFDAMLRLAKRRSIFASPYIGKNLETNTFRAILESLKVFEKKDEVDCIINVIDINRDRKISAQELKSFLFPDNPPNFMGHLAVHAITEIQKSPDGGSSALSLSEPLDVEDAIDQVDTSDINSVASTFRTLLLANCENERESVISMFNDLDSDGDGHLSIEEMKDVLVNFFLNLRGKFIEEVAHEIQAILLQHIPLNESGSISLADYRSFLLSEDFPLTPDALAAQQLVSSKLQLSALLSNSENGLAQQVADIIASADKDGDGFLLSSEVLDTLQQLLTERFRLEVEEDASGMNTLLFEFVDTDKSETIELPELLAFLWPEPSSTSAESSNRSFEQVERQVRQKMLERLGLAPSAAAEGSKEKEEEEEEEEADIKSIVDKTSDFSLNLKFKTFLESFPPNKGLKCKVDDIFLALAMERALSSLPMPEFGGSQQLTRQEVSLLLASMDANRDEGITLKELRSWLTR